MRKLKGEDMRRIIVLFVICFFVILIGCKEDSTSAVDNGRLRIYLTDAPAAYDSVNITFSEVSAHLDSAWISVLTEPITYDLLDLSGGKFQVLGAAEIPAGHYTQIRIKIDDAKIGVDGNVFPLEVPSGAQTGLKFGPEFTIVAGSTYELMVDFDASRSIVVTGSHNNPNGYKLKPHLRVVAKAVAGSISGQVTNPDNVPTAYAIQGQDTVTSASINMADSTFVLGFLPEGLYTVSIRDTSDHSFNQENVLVTLGANNDIGSVTLQ